MTKIELLLLILAFFGGVDFVIRVFQFLTNAFPYLLTARAKLWRAFSDLISVPFFRRKAVAVRVEEVLNQTVFDLQRFLPKGWIRRAKINWVSHPKTALLRDGNIVLRVRPASNVDFNLMQALWTYFSDSLFPESRDLLPKELVAAIALAITRTGLAEHHRYLLEDFDKIFLPNIGGAQQEILDFFGDCVRLNEFGLLMGPFIREVEIAATNSRFRPERALLTDTIRRILEHMLSFQPVARGYKPESEWVYRGPCSSYGFLLVSKPPEVRPAIDVYVKRAQMKVQNGIDRLYVIGRHEERDFMMQVLTAVLGIRELKGLEIFVLYRDYRGELNGIGALLGLDRLLAGLKLSQRNWEGAPSALADSAREFERDEGISESDLAIRRDLSKVVEDVIVLLSDYDGAWLNLAEFGNELRKQIPGFTPQKYGKRNLFSVLKKLEQLEFEERGAGPAKVVFVRMRSTGASGSKIAASNGSNTISQKVIEVVRMHAQDDGWIFLGQLGHVLKVQFQNFSYGDYGANSLRELIEAIPGLELEERGDGHSKTYVREKKSDNKNPVT